MGWFSSRSISEILQAEKLLLDKIFGAGQYEIENDGNDAALVRSPVFTLRLECDRGRVGDVMTYLSDGRSDSEYIHALETWSRFLDDDWPTLPVNSAGKTTVSVEQQVKQQLEVTAHVAEAIFSDPQIARDASFFADGYLKAYGDWGSAKGYWKDREGP